MDVHIGCVKRKQTLLSQLQLIFAYHNTLEVFHDEKQDSLGAQFHISYTLE